MTARRVVVKIGTSSLTDAGGAVATAPIRALVAEVAALRQRGDQVVVVTSGAVTAGVSALGLTRRPSDRVTLQALAAVGQPKIMEAWTEALGEHDLVPAEVLLVPHDFVDRRQYLHIRTTMNRLLDLGIVPVVNENDAIARGEARYGDNDRLAALLAHNLSAAVLVLLTDTNGLFTADPALDPTARRVERVGADDPILSIEAGRSATDRGSGGMASKLQAARIASWSGVRTVIAAAGTDDILQRSIDAGDRDLGVGTTFEAHPRQLGARRLWIAFAADVAGAVIVDDGAHRALVERQRSLLAAGVTAVDGSFGAGDTIDVRTTTGTTFARGMVNRSADDVRRVAGKRSSDLDADVAGELINRDDLVLLPTS